jgi:hypothetical protein
LNRSNVCALLQLWGFYICRWCDWACCFRGDFRSNAGIPALIPVLIVALPSSLAAGKPALPRIRDLLFAGDGDHRQ